MVACLRIPKIRPNAYLNSLGVFVHLKDLRYVLALVGNIYVEWDCIGSPPRILVVWRYRLIAAIAIAICAAPHVLG